MKAHKHRSFPAILSFLLDNRLRRRLSAPYELLDELDVKPTDVVVDFGCGPGFYTVELARRTSRTVAVDISLAMLRKTTKAADKAGLSIETLQSDGSKLKLEDNLVDLLLLAWVYHEIESKENALTEFRRILKANGRLVLVESAKKPPLGLFGPPKVDVEKVREEILAEGFNFKQKIPYKSSVILVFTKVPNLSSA